MTVAAIFEATMSRDRAKELARLMREARATRPEGVISASLCVEGDAVQLVAYWRDLETFEAYLATVDVPSGVELMRKVGVEPTWRVVEVLDFG